MAQVKFGTIVTEIRGKSGGNVFSRAQGGSYMKNKSTPMNPQTPLQSIVRGWMTLFAGLFKSLGQTVIDAWNEAAVNFPKVNVFGDSYTVSGIALFTELNINLRKIGVASITTPPMPGVVHQVTLEEVLAAPGQLELAIDFAIPNSQIALVRATPMLSAGIRNYKKYLRDLTTFDSASGTAIDILTEYQDKFGTLEQGTLIGIEIVCINKTTGQSGAGAKNYAIVA